MDKTIFFSISFKIVLDLYLTPFQNKTCVLNKRLVGKQGNSIYAYKKYTEAQLI